MAGCSRLEQPRLRRGHRREIRLFEADGSSQAVLATDNVDPDSPLASFEFFATDVNTQGEVVFRAVEKDGKRGVWVVDGDDLRPVLIEGDVVKTDLGLGQLGQHDSSPVFGGAPQINNRGDVSITSGVHPEGDNQVEWGTGVFIAYADGPVDPDPPVGMIEVEPTSVTHSVEFGDSASTDVTFTNAGEVDAEVTLSTDTDWLFLEPAAYTVAVDDDVTVAFTTDSDGMESGTYSTEVDITTDTGQDL